MHKEQVFADGEAVDVRVFIALYDYDPYQSSPNDQPDAELPLSAGEHVFVTGDVDEVSGVYLFVTTLCVLALTFVYSLLQKYVLF